MSYLLLCGHALRTLVPSDGLVLNNGKGVERGFRLGPLDTTEKTTTTTTQPSPSTLPPPQPAAPVHHPFCLHTRTMACAAGNMCCDCGMVVGPENVAAPAVLTLGAETGSRRAPVTDGLVVTVDRTAVPVDDCTAEWNLHTQRLRDQHPEVMASAFDAFRRVYVEQDHGLTGNKARAVALVALLWATRRVYGNSAVNERYLIQELEVPTRAMNRAFSTLAAVVTLRSPPTGPDATPSGHTVR